MEVIHELFKNFSKLRSLQFQSGSISFLYPMSFVYKYRPLEQNSILFNLIFSLTIAGIITSLDVYFQQGELVVFAILKDYVTNAFWVSLGFILLGYPIIWLIKQLNVKVPWSENWLKRLITDVIIIIAISLITSFVFSSLITYIEIGNEEMPNLFLKYFTLSFIACMTFILLVESIVFFNEREEYLLKNEKLLRENLETKIEALKNQINPHFLFNNLNVLSSLVYKDPKVADRFIVAFSNIYRYVLEMQNEQLVTLEKELDFLQSYIYLMQQRFQNAITIHMRITKNARNKGIPPLTLQMLMENVVKHNAISEEDPITVTIESNEDVVTISNELKKRTASESGAGIGLKNIQERYELLSTKKPAMYRSDGKFMVTIPLLPIQND